MNRNDLFKQMKLKKSFLCIGLDTDVSKLPLDAILENYANTGISPDTSPMYYLHKIIVDMTDANRIYFFNKAIVDMTHDLVVAYKPNYWFYAAHGSKGIAALEKTVKYIKKQHPEIFVIIDLKGGDIKNTAEMIARTAFETMPGDAVTLNPYMGHDVVKPFFAYKDKTVILLAVTSNDSAKDFQFMEMGDMIDLGKLYEQVLFKSSTWGNPDNTMYVVGATKPEQLGEIRKRYPEHFILVPGVGAQGGILKEVAENGLNNQCGLLVNSARGIIYASKKEDFCWAAREKAKELQMQMAKLLTEKRLV